MALPLLPPPLPIRHLGLLSLTLLALTACQTPHQPYWKPGELASQNAGDVPLAVIEFDERGDYWNPKQFGTARKLLKSRQAPVLFTFVHGWRHDARREDSDLQSFQVFLNRLKPEYGDRLVGVYIGWRGAEIQEQGAAKWVSQPATLFSFWGRKHITDQMAGVTFQNTLWQLAALTRPAANSQAGTRGRAILIGHSFGGRVVERTLGPAAVAQMNNKLQMPYDLTFLINPASESLYARQLRLALRSWSHERPAIITLSAEDDVPVGKAWPLALLVPDGVRDRAYVYNNPKIKPESQKTYITQAVGHDRRQWTHQIKVYPPKLVAESFDATVANLAGPAGRRTFFARQLNQPDNTASECEAVRLPSVDGADHQLPGEKAYWVIPLGTNFLSGHGDRDVDKGVLNPAMTDLMSGLLATTEAIEGPRQIVPNAAPENTPATASVAASTSSLEPPVTAILGP